MIKIAFIEQDAGIGGAEVNLLYLFRLMNRERFRAVVIVPYEGPLTERLKELKVEFHVISRAKLMSTSTYIFGKKIFNPLAVLYDIVISVSGVLKIRTFLRRERVDIVHTNSMVAHVYGAFAAKLAGVPSIWHMQDIIDPRMALGSICKTMVFLGGILPQRIAVVSRTVGTMFYGKSASRVCVIYNGTDCKSFSPETDGSAVRKELGISDCGSVVGIVGRLTPWKGQREFLRAAAIVSEQIPETRFLIVGDTTFGSTEYKAELCRITEEMGLSSKVIFTGFRTDVSELIAAMDLCVLSSVLPDPCPLVLFDYMASGKPVVATKLGGAPEIVENGKNGFLVDPSRTDEFADRMIALLKDRQLRERISSAARKRVEECFTVEKFVHQFERLYDEVVR